MSAPRPPEPPEPEPPEVAVDWTALPDDWRTRPLGQRWRDETRRDYANRLRACVAEGLAPAGAWREFADWLVEVSPFVPPEAAA